MQIIKAIKSEDVINKAVEILNNGGLIIYPTETCYGVGVDATNANAVIKLLEYKRRPEGKAISIAVDSIEMAKKYVDINDEAKALYKKFLPGPVTIVSKSTGKLPYGLESENKTLGIRIPNHEIPIEIIKKLGKPITATSANSSGRKTPYTIVDILDNITMKQKSMVDLILDAGDLPHNPPSTVIDTVNDSMKILRFGDVNLGTLITTEDVDSSLDMQKQGRKLIKNYKNILAEKAVLLMFNADLGAGKTQFIKGVAKELGIKEIVNSPTFTMLKEYDYNYENREGKLIHIDAWRLESIEEMDAFQLQQYFIANNVIAIEWAGMAKEYLETISENSNVVKIYIDIRYTDLNKRVLRVYEKK